MAPMLKAVQRAVVLDLTRLPPSAVGAVAAFGLIGAALLAVGRKDYPSLHTILDTAVALLSGALALLLWDMGIRLGRPLPKWLAVSFTAAFVLELVHVLVTVEWSGPLAPIAGAAGFLRPSTWPPSVHLLSAGVAGALWLRRRGSEGVLAYAAAIVGLGAALFLAFQWLPTYTAPAFLGITRPALILAPFLWLVVAVVSFRDRTSDRLIAPLVWTAGVLLIANIVMLYSQAPHDGPAMVAHLGKVCGRLILFFALMRMASSDMAERIRAEAALARSNVDLERRVVERTRDIEQKSAELDQIARERLGVISRLNAANEELSSQGGVLRQQAEDIRRLLTPVLRPRDGMLLLPIIGLIDAQRAGQLTGDLLAAIHESRAKIVVMDITGVAGVDGSAANLLVQTAQAARVMGAAVTITGVSVEVSKALVGLGVDLADFQTRGDLQSGLENAERALRNLATTDQRGFGG
jgi:anti-anti-sigma regulatory factor